MSENVRTRGRKGNCATCNENEALYTCPACFINSCSLNCVKKHKIEKSCNGQRDKAAFVAIQEFNENHLLSDYRFLEEISRLNQSAQRGRQDEVMPTVIGKRRQVQIIARRQKMIEFEMLPPGFDRMKKNGTSMNKRTIMWTVELQFIQSGVTFFEHNVNENISLSKILANYLDPASSDPIKRQRIKLYIQAGGLEKVKVLIQSKPFEEVEKRGYHVLDVNKSLSENLVGTYIVEFPTLIVILAEKLCDYKIIENETNLQEQERNIRQQERNNSGQYGRRQRRRRGGKPDGDEQGEKKAKIEESKSNKKEETSSADKKDSSKPQTKLEKSEKELKEDAKDKTAVNGEAAKKEISSEQSKVEAGSGLSGKAEKKTKDTKEKEDSALEKNKDNEGTVDSSSKTSEKTNQAKKEGDGKGE